MSSEQPKVCVIVCDMAPYHEARYNAVVSVAPVDMVDAGQMMEAAYTRPDQLRFPVHRLDLSGLVAKLTALAPEVLVVPGWANEVAHRAILWALENDCALVTFTDSQLEGQQHSALKGFVKRQLVSVFDAAVVAGTRADRYMRHYGMSPEACFMGVDAVDNQHFARYLQSSKNELLALRSILELPERYILSVGRMVAQKNYSGLLKAYQRYVEQGAPGQLDLVIVGDGPLRHELEAQIHQSGLKDQVHLIGRIAYEDLPAVYRLADAFVLASNTSSETWGLVVNEAMAASRPVFVSISCGCSDDLVVNGKNGGTFDGNQVEALAMHFERIGDGSYDLDAMGHASQSMIQEWGVPRFADSFWQAVRFAAVEKKSVPFYRRWLLRLLFWAIQ